MLKEDFLYLFAQRTRKEVRIMPTIFPREEKAEALFDKIAKDPRACKRLMDAFYEGVACDEDSGVEEERVLVDKQVFTNALFTAYKNKDLSAFLMAVCGNSMFDLLRNAFLIPLRFNDKGKENPILLSDEDGNFIESDIHIPESKKHMFKKLIEKNRYLAYGFLEQHSFKEDMSIQTIQNKSHLGILVVQEMPEEVHEKLSDAQIYSGLWDSMMKLEDLLYNAFFYCGDFKGKYCVGAFLPFTHFEHNLEKNIEVSNSILYECIQKMLND